MIERRYQMLRISEGDYLLPSNDATVLWRISRYHEDGSLYEYDPADRDYTRGRQVRGTFWMVSKWDRPLSDEALLRLDEDAINDWNQWHTWETLLPTRREAIAAVIAKR